MQYKRGRVGLLILSFFISFLTPTPPPPPSQLSRDGAWTCTLNRVICSYRFINICRRASPNTTAPTTHPHLFSFHQQDFKAHFVFPATVPPSLPPSLLLSLLLLLPSPTAGGEIISNTPLPSSGLPSLPHLPPTFFFATPSSLSILPYPFFLFSFSHPFDGHARLYLLHRWLSVLKLLSCTAFKIKLTWTASGALRWYFRINVSILNACWKYIRVWWCA